MATHFKHLLSYFQFSWSFNVVKTPLIIWCIKNTPLKLDKSLDTRIIQNKHWQLASPFLYWIACTYFLIGWWTNWHSPSWPSQSTSGSSKTNHNALHDQIRAGTRPRNKSSTDCVCIHFTWTKHRFKLHVSTYGTHTM